MPNSDGQTRKANRLVAIPAPVRNQSAQAQEEDFRALCEARSAAAHAMLEADQAESEARRVRRQANTLRKKYEALLIEYNGQQRLPGT